MPQMFIFPELQLRISSAVPLFTFFQPTFCVREAKEDLIFFHRICLPLTRMVIVIAKFKYDARAHLA